RLEAESARLFAGFLRFAGRAKSSAQVALVAAAAEALAAELDEARLGAFEEVGRESIGVLLRLAVTAWRLRRAWSAAPRPDRALDEEPRPDARPALLRLTRMARRVRDLADDQLLGLRLERLLGARGVRAWEAFIFWLIVAVLGLIAVDHYSAPAPPGTLGGTTWADTAICAVLLADFLARLVLSPRRLSFLRRRFLTELLPSLPFGLLAGLEHAAGVRSIRLLRLARVFRVLRILRPLIRLLRLLLFAARAADRVVERNAWLLNADIVFFSGFEPEHGERTLLQRARGLDSWAERAARERLAGLLPEQRLAAARWRLALVAAELEVGPARGPRTAAPASGAPCPRDGAARARQLAVEDVIRTLRGLNADRVAETLGPEAARQVSASLRLFRLPFVRRLPLARYVLGPPGEADPLWTTARLGRVLGDLLAFAQRAVTWFADLYGSITGALLLDRIGLQLIRSAVRPALRLVLFGAFLGWALLLLKMTGLEFLEAIASALLRFLSLPALVLGALCLLPLFLGVWFRRIAGQAADFFERVAEAQFLGLTRTIKEREARAHLEHLAGRVLVPERRLLFGADAARERRLVERFCARGLAQAPAGEEHDGEDDAVWQHCGTLLLLHRTFLEGALFHRGDTQIANLLLGNLTLENVRRNRLRYSRKRMKRLERLDIGRGRGGPAGPAMWHSFITHTVSQLTARLVVEYNQHCLPERELAAAAEADRRAFLGWLEERLLLSRLRRERGGAPPPRRPPAAPAARGALLYRTTEFTSLHFLAADRERDEDVRRRFGAAVHNLMLEDRRHLIRTIFGCYPMQCVPLEKRTFNPYEVYCRYLASGRMYFAPLAGLWFAGKLLALSARRFVAVIRDVIHPEASGLEVNIADAGFDVARRKVHRMRRPVALEAVRLRAEFDLEYLGLALPGLAAADATAQVLAADLDALGASELEREEFSELRALRQRQVQRLQRVLEGGADWCGEAARAAATAFVCDHGQALSLIAAWEELRTLLDRVAASARSGGRRWRGRGLRRLREQVERCWPALIRGRRDLEAGGELLRRAFVEEVARAGAGHRQHLDLLCERLPAGMDAYACARETLLAVAERPLLWSEQIVAVRAVASLAMLDLAGYERAIRELGGFEEDGSHRGREPGAAAGVSC
ncbi:MAG: hypothetical protein HY812_10890, partial [Planctomycetes bacterium]|nr:hypothetical protein [Planctomycetota bacterium]